MIEGARRLDGMPFRGGAARSVVVENTSAVQPNGSQYRSVPGMEAATKRWGRQICCPT